MKTLQCLCSSTSRSFNPASCLLGMTLLVTGLWLTACKPVTSATIDGNTITMDNEGVLFAYRK